MNHILPIEVLGNYAWAVIPFGLFLGLLGYRMYKFSLAVIGFFFGFAFGSWLGGLLDNSQLSLILGTVLGLAVSIAAHFLIRFSFFLAGMAGGLVLISMALSETTVVAADSLEALAWLASGGLIGGFITLFLYRFLILFTTCLIGTYMVYIGTSDLFPPEMERWSWVLYLILLLVFLLVQIVGKRGHLNPGRRYRSN